MNHEYILVHDMTNLFTKEILLYSFSDIKLKQPIRVVIIAYFFLLSIIWTVPVFLIMGFSPFSLVIAIVPNFTLSTLLSKPVWGGKSFPDWLNTQIKFLSGAKIYYDNIAFEKPLPSLSIEHYITVSRRDEFLRLLAMKKQEKEMRKRR